MKIKKENWFMHQLRTNDVFCYTFVGLAILLMVYIAFGI